MSSVIKATLVLEQRLIPATIGISDLNPQLRLEERKMEVVTKLKPWPVDALPRISINSFGYGGANAHTIIESASLHLGRPSEDGGNHAAPGLHTFLLPFSARNPQSLAQNMANLASSTVASGRLRDLAHTLGTRRSSLPYRGYILATQTNANAQFTIKTPLSHSASPTLPLAYIFTGQGAQWPRMGEELLRRFAAYRNTVEDLDSYLARLPHPPTWSLRGRSSNPLSVL